MPSAAGQEAVIRKAYTKAALTTDETDYIEVNAHKAVFLATLLIRGTASNRRTELGPLLEIPSKLMHYLVCSSAGTGALYLSGQ